jgi:hypothetical protein
LDAQLVDQDYASNVQPRLNYSRSQLAADVSALSTLQQLYSGQGFDSVPVNQTVIVGAGELRFVNGYGLDVAMQAAALLDNRGVGLTDTGIEAQVAFFVATAGASEAAAESGSTGLNILNPNFEPDPVAILQNHVDAANAALTANPALARSFLSPAEYAQFQTPGGYALNYGKVIERLTASDVENNPLSNSLFDYIRNNNNDPDFVGLANTPADAFQFDVTTPGEVLGKLGRSYGPDTYPITYIRP